MNEVDIDNAIDTSFLDDSSIDSFESSEDALNVMDSVEIPAIEDTAIENGNIENIDLEDNLCEDTEMLNSEVNDIMDDAEVEELVFEDDQVENTLESESLESTIDQPVEEVTPDLSEMLDNVEAMPVVFDEELEEAEQVEEPYEAVENSEIEILQEDGIVDTLESNQEQLDPHEALNNMSEYMNAHNYGLDDYGTYSKDPEWQALNRDLQVANGIEPSGQVIEGLQEISPDVTLREFDDFEQSVLEYRPAFYETGSYYEQGVNEFGYQGTCGPTSQANAINQLLGTNELTENKVLSVAIDNNLCETHGALDCCGGTTTEQFMELYNKMNEQLGDKFETELFEYNNVLDANQVAERLENGDVINVAVDADTLWDQPRSYTNEIGARQGDSYSNHWITVTGVERMEDGEIKGFDIIDSGAGESYVSLDKYNDMCFGTDEHRVIDPTCIVLSRKNEGEQISLEDGLEDIHSFPENNADIAESKKPTIFDWIFHRKGE